MNKTENDSNNPYAVTLRDYIDTSIKSIMLYVDTKFTSENIAITKAEISLGERLNSMTEFRESLKYQASKFVTREELYAKLDGMDKNRKDNTALIIAILSLIVAVIGVLGRFLT